MSKVSFIKWNAGRLIGFALLVAVAVYAHREREAAQAPAVIKTAKVEIAAAEAQQAAVTKTAKAEVAKLRKEAAAVTTAPEAIKAISEVDPEPSAPLDAEVLPDAPDRVSVEALPLYQDLNACKQAAVNLNACTTNMALQMKIDSAKDTEIVALKRKPPFWKRFQKSFKVIGCVAGGAAAGGYAKGATGAEIGGAMGAAICQML